MPEFELIPLKMATFTFAPDEPYAGQEGVVVAYAVKHAAGILLFDSGFGSGNAEVDDRYRPVARSLPDALSNVGLTMNAITEVANCHLHIDHAGQNAGIGGRPIYAQRAEWDIAHTTEHTILEWIESPATDYRLLDRDHELVPGLTLIATPGHTPGHQSLVIDSPEGAIVLAGQAVYSRDEWVGASSGREGRSRAWDVAAYDASIGRLRALDPAEVRFAHDQSVWIRQSPV